MSGPGGLRDWHGWSFDPDLFTLDLWLVNGAHRRQVDLERLSDSAKVLDTVLQIAAKRWATPEMVVGLINAIKDLIHPQATLCSFGQSRHLETAEIRERCGRIAGKAEAHGRVRRAKNEAGDTA